MKKIYYFPGLMSALIIPVLFWYYINPYVDKTKYTVIDIGIPAKLKKDKSNDMYSFESVRNWDYKKIKVDPSKAKEYSKFYVSEIKSLQKRNEKETGIEFILDKNNSYGDFVSLLNDMAVAKHETYALDLEKTGNVFATVNYKSPKTEEEEIDCLLCHDTIYTYVEVKPDFKQYYMSIFQNLSKLPNGAYYIFFGFLLFLNISMFSIKERFQMQRFRLI
ncbi:hypothetical protein SAMN05421846_107162 [Chryseobacterium taeanense]|uniref:Uncharacterized protein n=1 Tax=Chryseobacterium taeanense TaxID=311334 RepID=A0A1G8KIM4_9FLAO|nr:hypothetical protein [Chryseobacterium taeanense]SDI43283.1 hypothetical protein SAMN05421846_107162 [Chryseobacterium taeanense]